MRRLGRFVSRYAVWVIGVFLLVGGLVAYIGVDPGSESDVLKFLPRTNPDVERFYNVNEKFGALNIAIIGIKEDDIFNADFMTRLDEATRVLQNEVRGIHRVLSLTTLSDFEIIEGEEGGVQPKVLVDVEHLPRDEKGWEELKAGVLAKRHVRGHFVNEEGNATVLLCYLAPKGQVVPITNEIKREIRQRFPDAELYWGGNPIISAHIFEVTERDMRRLTPWAVGLILLVTLLSFRDPVGVLLALVATVFGGTIAFAAMRLMNVKVNIVLSSMPVILFAVGSAYSIHFLVSYYDLRKNKETGEAVESAFSSVGPGILAAALTTVSGFFSFLAMDMQPMREFGLFTGIGILSCMLGALLLIPAVLAISKRKRKVKAEKEEAGVLVRWMAVVAGFASRKRVYILPGLLLLGLFGVYYSIQVKLAMETSSFFREGSEPDLANKFLSREFGGSQYVQIHVQADMDDPAVLKEIRRLGDRIETVGHVSAVQHVAQPFGLVSEAWVKLRRIPDTRERVQTLANFVLTDPASLQLMTGTRDEALIHAKVRTNDADELVKVVDEIRSIVEKEWGTPFVKVTLAPDSPAKLREAVITARASMVAEHITALLRRAGAPVEKKGETGIKEKLVSVQTDWKFKPGKEDIKAVEDKIFAHLRSAETIIELPPAGEQGDPARNLAHAVASLGPEPPEDDLDAAGLKALEGVLDEGSAMSLTATLDPYLEDAWKIQESRSVLSMLGRAVDVDVSSFDEEKLALLETALLDLQAENVAVRKPAIEGVALDQADTLKMKGFLTGAPVLNQGLSKSVEMNQIKSLVVSGVLVLLVMGIIFRSFLASLVAFLPAGMTILLIFGYMGFRGLYLDVGTSMIASIALGVGIDYAIHFMVWWRRSAKALSDEMKRVEPGFKKARLAERSAVEAAGKCGGAILTNALMVAGAFSVLAMGEAAPLKTFGTMTAGAMFLAAAMAFTAVPALSGLILVDRWAMKSNIEGAERSRESALLEEKTDGDGSFSVSAAKEAEKK